MKNQRNKDIKIVVIGGGTGSFAILSALKRHTNDITAIVNMVDDGGSTGVLRDEMGVLPPGDVRQCLVALSESPKIRDLFNYRFEEGSFKGHPFGNIFLSALEKMNGSFDKAVETASEVLRVKGKVIPATLDDVRLKMEWPDASAILHGERVIADDLFKNDPRKAILSLEPEATANPTAVTAIKDADLIVIAPGDIYSSVGPLLVIKGIANAVRNSKATKMYICNLVTKEGQTEGFSVCDHAGEIERFVGAPFLDFVLYNEGKPSEDVAKRYKEENAYLVKADRVELGRQAYKAVSGNFLGKMARKHRAEAAIIKRSLIRHNPATISEAVIRVYENSKRPSLLIFSPKNLIKK